MTKTPIFNSIKKKAIVTISANEYRALLSLVAACLMSIPDETIYDLKRDPVFFEDVEMIFERYKQLTDDLEIYPFKGV